MEQTITVTDVLTDDVDVLWPKVEDILTRAVERNQGEFTLEDIHSGLLSGNLTLWIAYDKEGYLLASAVCEMRLFPKRKICYILLMAGEGFNDWNWAINCIEDWAKENGADAIAAYTRRGFVRTMWDFGYQEVYTVIQKNLDERRLH